MYHQNNGMLMHNAIRYCKFISHKTSIYRLTC